MAAIDRGSREKRSSVNGSTIEKLMMSVRSLRKGSRYAVVTSGTSFMSDSWIAVKPRIEDPSNISPSARASSLKASTGIVKCCMAPGRSQKRTSTSATSSFSM